LGGVCRRSGVLPVREWCTFAANSWCMLAVNHRCTVRRELTASMESLKPVLRLVVDDHLAALAETDMPEEATRWELLEECRLDPDRPPTSYYERKSDQRVSTTDPDAALMRPRGERASLGYHDHCVVDGGKARIILHALVTPADVTENQHGLPEARSVGTADARALETH